MKDKTIKIISVENGFIAKLLPTPENPLVFNKEDLHVFETFESLIVWLRKEFYGKTEYSPWSGC